MRFRFTFVASHRFCDWAEKICSHKYSILIIIRFNDCPTWKCFQRWLCEIWTCIEWIRINSWWPHFFHVILRFNGILMFNVPVWNGARSVREIRKQVSIDKRFVGPDYLLRSRIMWINRKEKPPIHDCRVFNTGRYRLVRLKFSFSSTLFSIYFILFMGLFCLKSLSRLLFHPAILLLSTKTNKKA